MKQVTLFLAVTLLASGISAQPPPLPHPLHVLRCGAIKPIDNEGKTELWIYPNGHTAQLLHLPTGDGIDYEDHLFEYDERTKTLLVDGKKNKEWKVVIK